MTVNLVPGFADEDFELLVFILPRSLTDKENVPSRSIGRDTVVNEGAEYATVHV
jgi:hypothetical protein